MPKITKKSANYPLRIARIRAGQSLDDVAKEVGTTPSTLSRIESAKSIPTRLVARHLYDFFGGEVPLVAIFDPEWYLDVYQPSQEHPQQAEEA